jgi:hypothetical protein
MPDPRAVERLIADGYLRRDGAGLTATARWHAALARAALRLRQAQAPWRDLRLPIAAALAEPYAALDDEALAALVEAILDVEQPGLAPVVGGRPAPT